MDNDFISRLLDEARAMEEHYRDGMLYWKARRQELEKLVPIEKSPFWNFITHEMSVNDDNHLL